MDDERQVVTALRKGSHEAFDRLYGSYKYRVCGFIYKMLGSYQETEELCQSVFEKLWEHHADIDPERPVGPYIYKIARNGVYDVLRQRSTRLITERYLLQNVHDADEQTETLVLDRDMEYHLYKLIWHLPERRREIFMLRYMQKMPYRSIAKKLGISENTVDTQIRKAIAYLRKHVGRL